MTVCTTAWYCCSADIQTPPHERPPVRVSTTTVCKTAFRLAQHVKTGWELPGNSSSQCQPQLIFFAFCWGSTRGLINAIWKKILIMMRKWCRFVCTTIADPIGCGQGCSGGGTASLTFFDRRGRVAQHRSATDTQTRVAVSQDKTKDPLWHFFCRVWVYVYVGLNCLKILESCFRRPPNSF